MSRRHRAAPKNNRSCPTQKQRFPSLDAAKDRLNYLRYTNPNTEYLPIRAYECPFCRGWHLTSEQEGEDWD